MTTFASREAAVLPDADGKTRRARLRKQAMTAHQVDDRRPCRHDGPPIDVRDWRICRLTEAGFPPDLAARLAAEPGVDVHALLALVDRGCPPVLAARILAPLRFRTGPT